MRKTTQHKFEAVQIDGEVTTFEEMLQAGCRLIRCGHGYVLRNARGNERAVTLRVSTSETLRRLGAYKADRREARKVRLRPVKSPALYAQRMGQGKRWDDPQEAPAPGATGETMIRKL